MSKKSEKFLILLIVLLIIGIITNKPPYLEAGAAVLV